jgi:hypothetical protein
MKHHILIVPLVIMLVCLSCVTADPRNNVVKKGESSPLLAGTSWEYSEVNTGNPVYYIKFNESGHATWHDTENNIIDHLTAESTWERKGKKIRVPHNAGFRHIEGTLITKTNPRKIIGYGRNRHDKDWEFTMVEQGARF